MTATTPAPAIIPNFDSAEHTGCKLAMICSKRRRLPGPHQGERRFDMINKETMSDLKFAMLGNTATHVPQGLGGLPGMTAMATSKLNKSSADLDVPEVPEFLEQIVASGGHLWACWLSADMNHLAEEYLYDEVEGIVGASDVIEKTAGAQLLFI